MALWLKVLASKSEDVSSIRWPHMLEDNQLPKVVLWPPHVKQVTAPFLKIPPLPQCRPREGVVSRLNVGGSKVSVFLICKAGPLLGKMEHWMVINADQRFTITPLW